MNLNSWEVNLNSWEVTWDSPPIKVRVFLRPANFVVGGGTPALEDGLPYGRTWIGYVVNNHGDRFRGTQRIGQRGTPSKWPNSMAYKWWLLTTYFSRFILVPRFNKICLVRIPLYTINNYHIHIISNTSPWMILQDGPLRLSAHWPMTGMEGWSSTFAKRSG